MVPNMYKSPTEPWFMGVFNVGGKMGEVITLSTQTTHIHLMFQLKSFVQPWTVLQAQCSVREDLSPMLQATVSNIWKWSFRFPGISPLSKLKST